MSRNICTSRFIKHERSLAKLLRRTLKILSRSCPSTAKHNISPPTAEYIFILIYISQ